MLLETAANDWSRLQPFAIVVALFALVGAYVLPRLPGRRHAARGRLYLEVAALATDAEARALATRLRGEGLNAAADSEQRPADMGTFRRERSVDGRAFVVVREDQRERATALLDSWGAPPAAASAVEPLRGGVFAGWRTFATWACRLYLLLMLVELVLLLVL